MRVVGTIAPAIAMAASLASLACTTYAGPTSGERHVLDGGPDARPVVTCPSGEVCDGTIRGLAFAGARPEPHALAPIAEGGREAVRVYLEQSGGAPGLGSLGWSGPFVVRASDPAVLAVGAVVEPDVAIQAAGVGTSLLRVVDPSTDLLFDRVSLSVVAVARPRITSVESFYAAPDSEVIAVAREGLESGGATLSLRLVDAADATLWDDSLTVEGHPLRVHNPSFGLAAPPGAEAPLGLTLVLSEGDAPGPIDLRIVRDAGETIRTIHVVDAASASSVRFGARMFSGGVRPSVSADGTIVAPDWDVVRICATAMRGAGVIAGAPIVLSVDEEEAPSFHVDEGYPACGWDIAGSPIVITATMGEVTQTVRLVASGRDGTPGAARLSRVRADGHRGRARFDALGRSSRPSRPTPRREIILT